VIPITSVEENFAEVSSMYSTEIIVSSITLLIRSLVASSHNKKAFRKANSVVRDISAALSNPSVPIVEISFESEVTKKFELPLEGSVF
jgi:hypothetical protein